MDPHPTRKGQGSPRRKSRAPELDNLAIVSLHSLTILERPGPVDVLVIATGDAFLKEKGADESRGSTLRIEGKVKR